MARFMKDVMSGRRLGLVVGVGVALGGAFAACSTGSDPTGTPAASSSASAAGGSPTLPASGGSSAKPSSQGSAAGGGSSAQGSSALSAQPPASVGVSSVKSGMPSVSVSPAASSVGGAASGMASAVASAAVTGTGAASAAPTGGCKNSVASFAANASGTASDAAKARIEVSMGSDLPVGNTQRTVEFWAYIKSTDWVGEKNPLYYYGTGTNGQFGMDFGTDAVKGATGNHATLDPFTGGDFSDDSTNDLGLTSDKDQWVHIAMVWNGMVLKTYVNGEVKITTMGKNGATELKTMAGDSVLTIGGNPSNSNYFSGYLDEFRVWKAARTDAQIKDNYKKVLTGSETDLVGYWKFDDASGFSAADSATGAGHTPHPGMFKTNSAADGQAFVSPTPPSPVMCP